MELETIGLPTRTHILIFLRSLCSFILTLSQSQKWRCCFRCDTFVNYWFCQRYFFTNKIKIAKIPLRKILYSTLFFRISVVGAVRRCALKIDNENQILKIRSPAWSSQVLFSSNRIISYVIPTVLIYLFIEYILFFFCFPFHFHNDWSVDSWQNYEICLR